MTQSIKKELLPDVRFFGSNVGRTVHFDIFYLFSNCANSSKRSLDNFLISI